MERSERERQMTPAERRRRMEAGTRRQKERARKRRIRMMILLGGGILVLAVIGLIIFGIVRLVSGGSSKGIAANGDTYVIALDAGHGGEDIGRSSGETVEKNVTWEICSKLKTMLEGQGYQVILIREDDTRISKEERLAKALDSKADLLVSIHGGYSDDSGVSGAVSYYNKDNQQSQYLAEKIQEALLKESGAADGGTKEGSFSIISDTEMPSVLIEAGYISNEEEAASLADDTYQNNVAKGIAKGIIMSLEKTE